MNRYLFCLACLALLAPLGTIPLASQAGDAKADTNFFPIAVWLQDPASAQRYADIGINLYVGLWKGPTEKDLTELKKHNMRVVCSQNDIGLAHLNDPTIFGWMHDDEPDNAQELPGGKGYGPPVLPARVVEEYKKMRKADPSRPVLLNLGQGVAWDKYIGRSVRSNHPEDYVEYLKGCDIASFDIYPAVHESPEIKGKLQFVANGVSRLRKWAAKEQRVWNCIECTHIGNPKMVATPAQVKAEVWMSLISGSQGLIYFVHQFEPKFVEAALLADEQMTKEVGAINKQIRELAPILNGPEAPDKIKVSVSTTMPIEIMTKRSENILYVFSVAMRAEKAEARFEVADLRGAARAEVLGEDRRIDVKDGAWSDSFAPWGVHLYKITAEE